MSISFPHKVVNSFMDATRNWEFLTDLFPLTRTYEDQKSGKTLPLIDDEILNRLIPTGIIFASPVTAAPTNYLLCDGTTYLKADYENLWTFLSAEGVLWEVSGTEFKVPNIKGKAIVGFDSTQTEFDALNEQGGAKTVTLTAAQSGSPAHGHANGTLAVANATIEFGFASNTSLAGAGDRLVNTSGAGASNIHGHSLTGTIADSVAAAAASAHNNLPPYITLNYIIKT